MKHAYYIAALNEKQFISDCSLFIMMQNFKSRCLEAPGTLLLLVVVILLLAYLKKIAPWAIAVASLEFGRFFFILHDSFLLFS